MRSRGKGRYGHPLASFFKLILATFDSIVSFHQIADSDVGKYGKEIQQFKGSVGDFDKEIGNFCDLNLLAFQIFVLLG